MGNERNNKRILIIDNEPDNARHMKHILSNEGYETDIAHNGKYGLRIIKNDQPDLVLLDIMMPGKSGWEVLRAIKEINKEQKVAFLGIAEISKERKNALMGDGLSDYIMKPFTRHELLGRIKAILPIS